MGSKWSWNIGSMFGIKIYVHWTFIFIVLWVIYLNSQGGLNINDVLSSIFFVISVFACVVFHELGHALSARKFGIGTKDITLLPIGGIARLEKMPDDPTEELIVAVAGPMVNVVIAFILGIILLATGGIFQFTEFEKISLSNMLPLLFFINIFLVLFNILPAFPMDGGRMLRAILSYKMNRSKATRIAASIGQGFSVIFVILGLMPDFSPFLILIGVFIFLAAQAEAQFADTQHTLMGHKIKDVMMRDYTPLKSDDSISRAVQILLNGQEQEFVVLNDKSQFIGVLSRNDLIQGLSEFGNDEQIGKIVKTNVPELEPEMFVEEVYMLMAKEGYPILPVMYNGHIVGVVDRENIMEFIWVKNAMRKK